MKVLVADKFEQSGIDGIKSLGYELVYSPDLKEDALTEAIIESKADVVVVRSTKVTAPMLEKGCLSLVIRAGAGYNTIDVATASKFGIYVSNCPGKNSIAVAELAFALMLSLDRRIADNVIQMRQGQWNKKEFSNAKGLFGRTLGLVGVGNIGKEMIPRAKAFGMHVVAWSRSLTPQKAEDLGVEYKATPEAVATACNVLSVHVSSAPETKGLVGKSVFNAMKPGSYFINTSRAEVVDHEALLKAVQEKGIRAGLDVFPQEPTSSTDTFADPVGMNAGIYGTHHIGASTEQAQEAIAAETVRILREFKENGTVPNTVNLCKHSPATHMLAIRHLDRVGVLAHIFDELRTAGINVQETHNVVFQGADAAIAEIHLDGASPEETNDRIKAHPSVLALTLTEL